MKSEKLKASASAPAVDDSVRGAAENPLSRFMTEQAAAAFCDKSIATMRTWAARRKGPPRIKVGRSVLYDRGALAAWLLAQQVDPAAARSAARG